MTQQGQNSQSQSKAQPPQSKRKSQPSDDAGTSRASKTEKTSAPDDLNALIQKMEAGRNQGQQIDGMRKDVVNTLQRSIQTIRTGDLESRKATVAGLQGVRSELLNMSNITGQNNTDILESLDAMIAAGEKQIGVSQAIKESLSLKNLNTFEKFTKGFFGEMNPLIKLAANLAVDARDKVRSIKERSKDSAINDEDVKGLKESLENVAEVVPVATTTLQPDTDQKAPDDSIQQPTANLVPVTAPQITAETNPPPIKEKSEDNQTAKETAKRVRDEMPPMELWAPPVFEASHLKKGAISSQGNSLNTDPEKVTEEPTEKVKRVRKPKEEPPKVVKQPRIRDSKGRFAKAESESDSTEAVTKQPPVTTTEPITDKVTGADNSVVKAIEALTNLVQTRFGTAPPTEQTKETEHRQLEGIKEELEKIRGLQEQATQLAKDQNLNSSKDRLRKVKPTGGGILAAKTGKGDDKGGSLIGNAISGALGGLLAGPLGAIAAVAGATLIKGAKGILKLFNPMNWIRGGMAVLKALSPSSIMGAVSTVGNGIQSIYSKGASRVMDLGSKATKAVGSGIAAAGSAVERVTQAGKAIGSTVGGKALGFMKSAKAIPVVGNILTAAFAIYDFFDGYNKAADILGKKQEELTTWDKVSAGVGKAIGSITGIIDSIGGLFGFDFGLEKTVTEFVAKTMADLPETIGKWKDSIAAGFSSMTNAITEWVNSVIRGAASTIAEKVPGGKWLMEKLGVETNTPSNKEDVAKIPANAPITPQTEAPTAPGEMTREQKLQALEAIDRPSNNMPNRVEAHNQRMDNLESIEQQRQRNQAATQVNQNINNSRSTTTNNYTTGPLTTRNPDDSHRKGL